MFCFPVKFFGETADKRVVEGVCPEKRTGNTDILVSM